MQDLNNDKRETRVGFMATTELQILTLEYITMHTTTEQGKRQFDGGFDVDYLFIYDNLKRYNGV